MYPHTQSRCVRELELGLGIENEYKIRVVYAWREIVVWLWYVKSTDTQKKGRIEHRYQIVIIIFNMHYNSSKYFSHSFVIVIVHFSEGL